MGSVILAKKAPACSESMSVFSSSCAPLFASATTLGERCGTKAFGPDSNIVCDEGLSCQQWQGLRGPGAHYCLGPCIEEGGETSKDGVRFGVCCEGLERVKRKCVVSSRVQL